MDQRILFRLTTTHLIVANTGTVFSKEGLKSIVYTDTSSKTSNLKTFPDSEKQAQDYISELIQKKCNTFKDLDQLASDNSTDRRTAGDYSERLLLELLQNAIDAGGGEQIGKKGIGFRSVLNGINIIEIHSGHFHVRWSDNDAKKTLELNQIATNDKKPPLLALPTWCENKDDEIQTLLNNGYDTVIRLTLTEQGINNIKKEWKQFSNDPSLLLFLNNNIELQWECEGYPQIQWRRNQTGEFVNIEVNQEGFPLEMRSWRQFNSRGAMSAYIVDNNQQFQERMEKNPLLCSFFPAALSYHPFQNLYLHHSDFKLQSNREAVVIDIDDPCLNDLAEVILLAASSMENETDILDLLRVIPSIPQGTLPTSSNNEKTEIIIWKKVKPELAEKKFKGLKGRRLTDIKSCPKYKDMPYFMRNENRWKIWKAFLSALKVTRLNGLSGLHVLQPGTENKQREETLLKYSEFSPFDKKEIQELPWAPVESPFHPVSSSETKIFLPIPSKGKIQQPPDGVEVRFLISNFLEDFKNKDDNAVSFLQKILGVHEFSAIGVIKHCVLPFLETTQKHGASDELISFLKSLREADTKEVKVPIESFDWGDSTRCNLARKLYLKCQKKVWPIFNIYADQKWTENRFLENVYWGKRGFLNREPPKDKKEKVAWEKFWKWLGVGWYPKIMPLLDDVICKSGDRKGLEWDEKNFQGKFFNKNKSPNAWDKYCNTLIKKAASMPYNEIKSLFERSPRIKQNWTIDGGSQLLERQETFYIIASNWPAYKKWMNTIISYSSNKQHDYDNEQTQVFPSFFLWLIQTASWVPGADGCRHKGRNVFLNTGPVAKEIASQFITALTVSQKDGLQEKHPLPEKFLEACSIRSGWKEVKDSDWKSWLKKASEMDVDNKKAKNREVVRLLYRALLDHRKYRNQKGEPVVPPINVFPLWGIERTDDINENWHLCKRGNPPFFIDRGDLADLKLHGLKTFPVRLDGLSEKTQNHFGIKPLSEHLTGEPLNKGRLMPNFSDKAKDRINEIIAYLRIDNEKFQDKELEEKIGSVKMRHLTGLKVQFLLNGAPLDKAVHRDEFHQKSKDGDWTTFVDESKCSIERQWEVFSESILLSCESDINKRKQVRDLLQCEDSELHSELIRAGVSPETAEDLKQKKKGKDVLLPDEPDPSSSPVPMELLDEPVPPIISDIPPTIVSPEPIKTPPSSPKPFGENGEIKSAPRNSLPTRPHPGKGLEAQSWLFKKVRQWCQDTGKPEPLYEKDKEDITIELKPPIVIEVKRIKGNAVFWSKNQIQKAHSELDKRKYVIALLRPHDTEGYEVFWVMNPIDDLKLLSSRHIQWRWKTHQGGKYDSESWEIPEPPPQKKADSYSAVIKLAEDWIDKLPKEINSSLDKISRTE